MTHHEAKNIPQGALASLSETWRKIGAADCCRRRNNYYFVVFFMANNNNISILGMIIFLLTDRIFCTIYLAMGV